MEKKLLLRRKVAPSWGFVICVGAGENKRASLEESGAE
jgi:hypothetical protein